MPNESHAQQSDAYHVGIEDGRYAGYVAGNYDGYWLGRKRALSDSAKRQSFPRHEIRIMYIKAGFGYPYPPIDQAIEESLRLMAKDVLAADPIEDLVGLAAQWRPDFVFALSGINVPEEIVAKIRGLGIRTGIWLCDDPYYTDITIDLARRYDMVFTIEASCVDLYRDHGSQHSYHLPLGVNHNAFYPIHTDASGRFDVVFIGSAYWHRVRLFDEIMPYLLSKRFMLVGLWWNRLTHYESIKDRIRLDTWMTPEETNRIYNGTKIIINLHRTPDDDTYNMNSRNVQAYSLNPRIFEVNGAGAFQLTDERRDLSRIYSDNEIVTYTSPEDLVSKIEYYLQNDAARQEMSVKAMRTTLRTETYHHRIAQLLQIITGA